MPLKRAARLSDLSANNLTEFIDGDDRYAICRVEGQIVAVEGTCPHLGGPLAQGALHGRMLVCPWHAWEFDCLTGAYDRNPDCRLRAFPVVVTGEEIFLQLD